MLIAELYASLQGEGVLTGTPSVFLRTSGCNLRCWFCDTPYTSWQPEGQDFSVEEIVAEVLRQARCPRLPHPARAVNEAQGVQGRSASEHVDGGGERGRVAALLEPAAAVYPTAASPVSESTPPAERIDHVVITGGEPMLFAEMIPLCQRLHDAGMHLTIETAGTLFLPVICDLMSISPKLANSTPPADRAGRWAARHERTRHNREVIRQLTGQYDYQIKFVIDAPADLEEVDRWLAEFPHLRRERVLLMPQGTDLAALRGIGQWLAPYCAAHGFGFCPRKHIEWYGAKRGT